MYCEVWMSRIRKTEMECSCASKRLKMNARATSWVTMKSVLSDTTLEPNMRVAFSKSGTSSYKLTRFHLECAEEQCMCKPYWHRKLTRRKQRTLLYFWCQCLWKLNCEKQTVRKRIRKNWSVKRQQRRPGLAVTLARVLWYVPVSQLLLHCGHCLWDWTFPHGSRKQQTNVCTRQHISKQFWVWGLSACLLPRRALTHA